MLIKVANVRHGNKNIDSVINIDKDNLKATDFIESSGGIFSIVFREYGNGGYASSLAFNSEEFRQEAFDTIFADTPVSLSGIDFEKLVEKVVEEVKIKKYI